MEVPSKRPAEQESIGNNNNVKKARINTSHTDPMVIGAQNSSTLSNGNPTTNDQPTKTPSNVSDFMKRFGRRIEVMTRKDIEEFIMVKISEYIVCQTEISDMKFKLDRQEAINRDMRTKLDDLRQSFKKLNVMYKRLEDSLKDNGATKPILKITRSVGVQVKLRPMQPTIKGAEVTREIPPFDAQSTDRSSKDSRDSVPEGRDMLL